MKDESGFFNANEMGVESGDEAVGFHDFRLLHSSSRGFARVYLAKKHGRNFIVKCLREEFRHNPIADGALRKEFDSGFMVDSVNVAHTIDLIEIPEYGKAIVIEYCPGKSLAEIIDGNETLTLRDIDAIVKGTSRALDDIHAAGIVHRDIKPCNVIYSPRTATLKVIDFGCSDAESYYILHGGAGTERYTPPGCRSDEGNDLSAFNDLYAFGVMLSELVAVAPAKMKKALEATALAMTSGRVADGASAVAYFESSLRHRRHLWLLLLGFSLVVAGAIAAFMAYNAGSSDNKPLIEKRREAMETVEVPLAEVDDSVTVAKNEPTEEIDCKSNVKTDAKKISGSEGGRQEEDVNPEDVKNEYGVSHAEAKYMRNFKRSEFDHYVIRRADFYLMEYQAIKNNTSADSAKRVHAVACFNSADSITDRVMADALRKFGDAVNRNRLKGLVKERHIFWMETYRPYPWVK